MNTPTFNHATTCPINPISSSRHLVQHPALPHYPNHHPQLRPVSNCLQDCKYQATPQEPPLAPLISVTTDLYASVENSVSTQLSFYLSQNNLLDGHQSDFKALGPSMLPEPGLPHSSWLVCSVQHNEPPDHPVHLSCRAWHSWICIMLFHFLPDTSHLSGHMELIPVHNLHPWNRSSLRLSTRTPSVLDV